MTSHTHVKTIVSKSKIIHLILKISFYVSVNNMKILIIQPVLREFSGFFLIEEVCLYYCAQMLLKSNNIYLIVLDFFSFPFYFIFFPHLKLNAT